MLFKRTVVSQVEITEQGHVQIRLGLQVVDQTADPITNAVTETIISNNWHRTAVVPGGNIDAQMAAVHSDIAGRFGMPPVDVAAIDRIKALAAVAWTPDVVAAYQAALAAQQNI